MPGENLLPPSGWPLTVLSPAVQGHRLRGDQSEESAQTKSRAAPQVSPTIVPSAIRIYKIIAMTAEIYILLEASLNC